MNKVGLNSGKNLQFLQSRSSGTIGPLARSLVTGQIGRWVARGSPLQSQSKKTRAFPILHMLVILDVKTLDLLGKEKVSSKKKF